MLRPVLILEPFVLAGAFLRVGPDEDRDLPVRAIDSPAGIGRGIRWLGMERSFDPPLGRGIRRGPYEWSVLVENDPIAFVDLPRVFGRFDQLESRPGGQLGRDFPGKPRGKSLGMSRSPVESLGLDLVPRRIVNEKHDRLSI
jgi:hypothetical protein